MQNRQNPQNPPTTPNQQSKNANAQSEFAAATQTPAQSQNNPAKTPAQDSSNSNLTNAAQDSALLSLSLSLSQGDGENLAAQSPAHSNSAHNDHNNHTPAPAQSPDPLAKIIPPTKPTRSNFTNNTEPNTLLNRFADILNNPNKKIAHLAFLMGFFRVSGFARLWELVCPPANPRKIEQFGSISLLVGIRADAFAEQIAECARHDPRDQSPAACAKRAALRASFAREFFAQQARDLSGAEYSRDVEASYTAFLGAIDSGRLRIRIVAERTTHAKFYVFAANPHKTRAGGLRYEGSLVVGSSNLSENGLVRNYEFNLESCAADDVAYALAEFYELWQNAVPLEAAGDFDDSQNPAHDTAQGGKFEFDPAAPDENKSRATAQNLAPDKNDIAPAAPAAPATSPAAPPAPATSPKFEFTTPAAHAFSRGVGEQSFLKIRTPREIYFKLLIEHFGKNVIKNDESLDALFPPRFHKPRYQKDAIALGLGMLRNHNGFFLSDVVGLGKTLIACIIAKKLALQDDNFRFVVVAPKALQASWHRHFELLDIHRKHKITTYDQLRKLKRESHTFSLVIVDESHNLAANTSQRYATLQEFCQTRGADGARKRVILLSATPQKNSPADILAQMCLFQDPSHPSIDGVGSLRGFFAPLVRRFGEIKKRLAAAFAANDTAKRNECNAALKEISETIRQQVLSKVMIRRTRGDLQAQELWREDLREQKITFPEMCEPQPLDYTPTREVRELMLRTFDAMGFGRGDGGFGYYRYLIYPNLTAAGKAAFEAQYSERRDFDQTARSLQGLIKILLFKRFESSIVAFRCSLKSQITSIRAFLAMLRGGGAVLVPKQTGNLEAFYAKVLENDGVGELGEFVGESAAAEFGASFGGDFALNSNLADGARLFDGELGGDFGGDLGGDLGGAILSNSNLPENRAQNYGAPQPNSNAPAAAPAAKRSKFVILAREHFAADFEANLARDLEILQGLLREYAAQTADPANDAKLTRFKEFIAANRGKKLVVFTEALATARYLHEQLTAQSAAQNSQNHAQTATFSADSGGATSSNSNLTPTAPNTPPRVIQIDSHNRDSLADELRENFDANAQIQRDDRDIVITTDTLAEGVNLHRANIVINYDSPWNATRLMQRIGRINRIGTPHARIFIYNFKPSEVGDRVLNYNATAFTKLQSFHLTLGEDSAIYDASEEVGSQQLFRAVAADLDEVSEEWGFLSEAQNLYKNDPDEFARINALGAKSRTFVCGGIGGGAGGADCGNGGFGENSGGFNGAKSSNSNLPAAARERTFVFLKNPQTNARFFYHARRTSPNENLAYEFEPRGADFLAMARFLKEHATCAAHTPTSEQKRRHYDALEAVLSAHAAALKAAQNGSPAAQISAPKPEGKIAKQTARAAASIRALPDDCGLDAAQKRAVLGALFSGRLAHLPKDIAKAKTAADFAQIYEKCASLGGAVGEAASGAGGAGANSNLAGAGDLGAIGAGDLGGAGADGAGENGQNATPNAPQIQLLITKFAKEQE